MELGAKIMGRKTENIPEKLKIYQKNPNYTKKTRFIPEKLDLYQKNPNYTRKTKKIYLKNCFGK